MPHNVKSESLSGHLQQLLFSPKGGIEGLLLQVDHKLLQVSMKPGSADAKALNDAVGKPIEVIASPDHSLKSKAGAHPVYQLDSITTLAGKAFKSKAPPPISGAVAHGEARMTILGTALIEAHEVNRVTLE